MRWWMLCVIVPIGALVAVRTPFNAETNERPRVEVRRIAPADAGLRGDPDAPVTVTLELRNPTSQPVQLAPPSLNCSCQLQEAPATTIAPGRTTRMSLRLRYPRAGILVTPLAFTSVQGESLGRADVA
jgi:hypothetical protein